MSTRIRAFIAVKIDATPPLRKVLTQLKGMGSAVRGVESDHLHVTLKFLGDTDLNTIPDVAKAVKAAAEDVSAFEVQLVGLGAFPRIERPTVVWAGLQSAGSLVTMAERLQLDLADLGFAPEARRFVPHLTLARIKARPPDELGELLQQHPATNFGTAFVDEVELLQSELTPAGPIYTRLAAVELAE